MGPLEDPRQPREHPVARAHLRTSARPSPPVYRYEPPADLRDRIRHVWVPVWDIPDGEVWEQHVLAYPCCQLVVGHDYARLYGVVRGLSTVSLQGRGWVVGTMLTPAAGWLVTREPVSRLVDTWVDLQRLGAPWADLAPAVRAVMGPDPTSPSAHRLAADLVARTIRRELQLDPEGALLNALVDAVESDPQLLRVDQLARRFALSERSLQRLVSRRLGLTPRWLVQRRRLQEAAERLRAGQTDLAGLAAYLGYADQAHLSRDFRAVTGLAPSQFRAEASRDDPAARTHEGPPR
ncbi:MAG: helix-turn-helix domain-containing protein [Dermatophilaceae bacterium]